jgi:hypothetical protein
MNDAITIAICNIHMNDARDTNDVQVIMFHNIYEESSHVLNVDSDYSLVPTLEKYQADLARCIATICRSCYMRLRSAWPLET